MKDWTPEEIKALRSRFKVTQSALADMLGVTRVYVGLLERNEKTPSKPLRKLLDCIERELTVKETTKGASHGKKTGQ